MIRHTNYTSPWNQVIAWFKFIAKCSLICLEFGCLQSTCLSNCLVPVVQTLCKKTMVRFYSDLHWLYIYHVVFARFCGCCAYDISLCSSSVVVPHSFLFLEVRTVVWFRKAQLIMVVILTTVSKFRLFLLSSHRGSEFIHQTVKLCGVWPVCVIFLTCDSFQELLPLDALFLALTFFQKHYHNPPSLVQLQWHGFHVELFAFSVFVYYHWCVHWSQWLY